MVHRLRAHVLQVQGNPLDLRGPVLEPMLIHSPSAFQWRRLGIVDRRNQRTEQPRVICAPVPERGTKIHSHTVFHLGSSILRHR